MLGAATLAFLSCCSGAPATPPTSGASGASSDTRPIAAPVSAKIDQFRDNYAAHIIQIQVSNNGTEAVTVVAAAVRTGQFSSPVAWTPGQEGTLIPPGQTKSLPAALPSPECNASAPVDRQNGPRLELRVAGTPSAATLPIDDPYGVLARNNAELCLDAAVESIVRFEFAAGLRRLPGSSGVLTLKYLPQGRDGSITIESFHGTTLISEDSDSPWPKGTVLNGRDPAGSIALTIRPTRCDPHAVAEDKVGTLLPLTVRVGDRSGIIKVPADTSLKGAIQDFVSSVCQAAQANQ